MYVLQHPVPMRSSVPCSTGWHYKSWLLRNTVCTLGNILYSPYVRSSVPCTTGWRYCLIIYKILSADVVFQLSLLDHRFRCYISPQKQSTCNPSRFLEFQRPKLSFLPLSFTSEASGKKPAMTKIIGKVNLKTIKEKKILTRL
jgi:hypothetical protein